MCFISSSPSSIIRSFSSEADTDNYSSDEGEASIPLTTMTDADLQTAIESAFSGSSNISTDLNVKFTALDLLANKTGYTVPSTQLEFISSPEDAMSFYSRTREELLSEEEFEEVPDNLAFEAEE